MRHWSNAGLLRRKRGRGGAVLPEQYLRAFDDLSGASRSYNPREYGQVSTLLSHAFYVAYAYEYEKPHTLTGDAWRIAWAEAHDAQTDQALDAVY